MLALLAKTGVFLSQTHVIASITLLGLLTPYRRCFARALVLVLFTMIYNLYLKSLWQAPLPPPLEGWAFPSGHMHTAFVFWSWLAYEYGKLWFAEITFFGLCLVGYGLIYQGYHYPVDILGSVAFGSLSVLVYALLLKSSWIKTKGYRLNFLLCMLGTVFLFNIPPDMRKPHVYQAWGGLLSVTFIWFVAQCISMWKMQRDNLRP